MDQGKSTLTRNGLWEVALIKKYIMIENKCAQSDSKQCAIKIEFVKKCPKELSFTIGLMSHNLYITWSSQNVG